ncbi:hypothetical protein Pint_00110 [Pistacia integerrima]|uniref:Uncharacterized protein n=1 Tax=Pistacia integerrima TaxID=434235 RepID=A0ACC0ZHZ1_9ROSI|nr:hypothetical protein Pint_00110 [Pistacia integerrima]
MAHVPPLTIFIVLSFCLIPLTYSVPFVVLHGISDKCSNRGVTQFTELLSKWSGSQGYCMYALIFSIYFCLCAKLNEFPLMFMLLCREIGDGSWDSWTMPLTEQTAIACEKVKGISELSGGYNLVGLSQGTMIGRGVIEFCDGGPSVKNFISLAGIHAGTASIPFCGSVLICILLDSLIKTEVYSNYVQEHLAPSGYLKIPTDIPEYLKGCRFLPKLNNELADKRNSTYKERFSSLENLVLIMFEQDTVLIPKETSWFGYFPDGSFDTILSAQETPLYIDDWIGLKTLDEAGKVKFINVSGNHLQISRSDMKTYIVPYLKDQTSTTPLMITESSSSHRWLSSMWNFFVNLAGFSEDQHLLWVVS